jgi:type IV secretory pathway VirB10-like protein
MSDTYEEGSARERYSPGVDLPRRRAVSPFALFIIGVCFLMLIAFLANNYLDKLRGTGDDAGPPKSSASQTMLGPPPPFNMQTEDEQHNQADNHTSSPPTPQKTVAQKAADYITQATGTGGGRSILTVPQGWDRPALAASIPQSSPPTAADRAAAATGQRPTRPKIDSVAATAISAADLTTTIKAGTKVFCTTQDAIDTTVGEGSFTCDTDQPIIAWDGVTPLVAPHSTIIATYKELKSGRDRIYAASATLYGPDGLILPLGDPFTMPDGSAGIHADVQDNTWARIKEGVILDFVSSAFQAAESLASQGNGNTYLNLQTGGTQNALSQTLEHSNVPDVGRVPQARHLSLRIMHPVFMQDAIGFQLRGN